MTMNRRNRVRGLYPTASELNLNPFQLSISDEEAFGLSKFCRWVGTEIVNQPWTPEDAALMLRLETEPRIVCIPAVYGGESNPVHVSHLLTSQAVVRQLLAVAADPDAPMFSGCRTFAMQYREQLAACSGLHLTVTYWPSEQASSTAPINPTSPCSMPA
jgi:hypothetical protein